MRLMKLTDWLLRFPLAWIGFIILVTIILGYFGQFVKQDYTLELFFPQGDEEMEYFEQFKAEFEPDDNIIIIGFKRDDLWSNIQIWHDIKDLTAQFEKIEGVEDVLSLISYQDLHGVDGDLIVESYFENFPQTDSDLRTVKTRVMSDSLLQNFLLSDDGKTTAFYLEIAPEQSYEFRAAILAEVEAITGKYADYNFHYSGIPVLRNQYIDLMNGEQLRGSLTVTPVIIIILFFTFRTIRGILLPLSVILMSIVWVVGWMGVFETNFDIMTTIMPTILLVVGLSDSIHLMLKYYEERNDGKDRKEALRETIEKLGMATFMTSITTAIGFGVLLTTNIIPMRNFGLFTAIGVMCAFVISIVFLNLMMLYLKPPRRKQGQKPKIDYIEKWVRNAAYATREKPVLIMVVSFIILIIMAAGIPRINVNSFLIDDVSNSTTVVKDLEFFEQELSGVASVEVIIDGKQPGAAKSPALLKVSDEITSYLRKYPEIQSVLSPAMIIKEINRSMHNDDAAYYRVPENRELIAQYLLLASLAGKDPFENYIDFDESKCRVTARMLNIGSKRTAEILDELKEFTDGHISKDYKIRVTGTTKLVERLNEQVSFNLMNSLILAFIIISILMGLLFRSIRWVIISIIPNIVPLIVIAGVMGWFGIRLRVTTAAVFSVAFGIAVDDTIHFLSRLKIELNEGQSLRDATQNSLIHTGKAIISTSLVLIAGFITLLTSDFQSSYDFGLLSSLTIFVALVTDLYLLPVLVERYGGK